ncbi:MAG: CRISPR system precrRNA processing endoribonuclease RAMP protein Cas6 [Bryobacteraceae bacterium]|jgi:hypothetical protein
MIPFEFYRVRLHLRARGALRFPMPAANLLRGALGYRLEDRQQDYARWFRPGAPQGGPAPSGLADWPRPFVLRASHLDGLECHPEKCWNFDVHVFAREAVWPLVGALAGAAERGMGRGRVASELLKIEAVDLENGGTDFSPGSAGDPTGPVPPISLNLAYTGEPAGHVSLRFVTPTELKGQPSTGEEPDFGTLFARLRDRLGNLRAFYGAGPLEVDFRGLGERARSIRLVHARLGWERAQRRSSRTGQVHPLGGFTGEADYEGDLGEFMPWLWAARWVGVGRQTVWGRGDVRVIR